MRRGTSRVSFLMCPFCVRASLLAWATPTFHALSRAYGLRRLPPALATYTAAASLSPSRAFVSVSAGL